MDLVYLVFFALATALTSFLYMSHWDTISDASYLTVCSYVLLYACIFMTATMYYLIVNKYYYTMWAFLPFGKRLTRMLYNFYSSTINALDETEKAHLMNWGYYDDQSVTMYNQGDKEAFRKRLYELVVNNLNKDHCILEIGCGRGGGIKHLYESKHFSNVSGVDLSEVNIMNCRSILKNVIDDEDLCRRISVGDAMDLDNNVCRSGSYDAVINIESSHCYPSFAKFLAETHRVLKKNGRFNLADFRTSEQWNEIECMFRRSKQWEIVAIEDITKPLTKATRYTEEYHMSIIKQKTPFFVHGLMHLFILGQESYMYQAFVNGNSSYKVLRLQKQ
eukprot:429213_1